MAALRVVSALENTLRAVADVLKEGDRFWALVGALAVSARTEPRFTRDVDVAVSVSDDPDAEAVVRRFVDHGYSVFSVLEQDAAKRLATARLTGLAHPGEASVIVDLLFASSGIEPEVARQSERLEVLPGVEVPVAQIGHLLALKVLSRNASRPQDAADIQALLKVLDGPERSRALDAAQLIVARGFDRGKDLVAEVTALLG